MHSYEKVLCERENAYALFESLDLVFGQSIGLGNDRDEIDSVVEPPHKLDIESFKSTK